MGRYPHPLHRSTGSHYEGNSEQLACSHRVPRVTSNKVNGGDSAREVTQKSQCCGDSGPASLLLVKLQIRGARNASDLSAQNLRWRRPVPPETTHVRHCALFLLLNPKCITFVRIFASTCKEIPWVLTAWRHWRGRPPTPGEPNVVLRNYGVSYTTIFSKQRDG